MISKRSREIRIPNMAESSRSESLDVGLRFQPGVFSGICYIKSVERFSMKDSDIFVETSCLAHEKLVIPYRILVRSRNAVHGSYLVPKGIKNIFRCLRSPVDRISSSFMKIALMSKPKDIEVLSHAETFMIQNLVPELHDPSRLAEAAKTGSILSYMTIPIAESMIVNAYLRDEKTVAFSRRVFHDMLTERDPLFRYDLDSRPLTAFHETFMFNDVGWEALIDAINRCALTEYAATFDIIATPHVDHFHEIRSVDHLANRYDPFQTGRDLEVELEETGSIIAALSHLLSYEYGTIYKKLTVEIERHWLDVVRIIVRVGEGQVLSDTYLDLALKSLTPVSLREERS